ncbi:unnamed protein product [Rhizoctonia solani]|uniref:LIM zinc-binding domain-containing protein n=1 Tax=Rhizoctonia solani TaxID=456999 RepID=A0A8H3BWX0_9AGAM|nr:unnamed protein product [Rhizoctonia solani]
MDASVRALAAVFHLECFRCEDCDLMVASKYFPVDGPHGRQQPLCERDYFRRLDLICAKCNMALRGNYITACDKKYHVEHFTCSVCPTLFGPQDSYYEHKGAVFCHWHYSTRFAAKCVGCNSAILNQFVDVEPDQQDSAFHPNCYLIHKFWNVKVVPRPPVLPILPSPDLASPAPVQLTYVAEEQQTTAESIKAAQLKMEARVYAIQTSLSGFEESSAACISDMLDHVGAGIYLDATRASERFILHVEVLFAATDEIEDQFAQDVPHDREARELCRKTVDLFTLMCNAPDRSGSGRTEEMLALVTGIADYLKSLVRVALARSLELEQELADGGVALDRFLERIKALAESGSDIYAQRLDPATYGYRSLVSEIAGESPFVGPEELDTASSSDLCVACGLGVEEDCVRLGACQRWHVGCVKCAWEGCTRAHLQAPKKESPGVEASVRRPRVQVDRFVYEPPKGQERVGVVYCTEHGSVPPCRAGFEAVSRLEQYAFLMSVASRRAFLGCD